MTLPRKLLFIGLGGAGQRHLRIFRQLLPASTIFTAYRHTKATPLLKSDFTIDPNGTIEDKYSLQTFDSLETAFDCAPDLTVISSPSSCHRKHMIMAVEAGSGVLVEKPWGESLEGFSDFSRSLLQKSLPFHISFQRRFHRQIAQARDAIISGLIGRPMAASFTVFSNVPSWHSYEDWRNLYAVRGEMGGGALLTEIHEIDLAHWFFGLPEAVFCAGGNRSSEKLSVEDTVHITLLYDNFSVHITLCFMHKSTSRSFHIAGSNGDIVWNESTNSLAITQFNKSHKINSNALIANEEMFTLQADRFLNNWTLSDTKESLASAAGSLAIVEAAKRSMHSKSAEFVDRSYMRALI